VTAGREFDELAAQVDRMSRGLRRMPAQSRQYMDDQMRRVGDRIARQIDQAAGSVPRPGRVYAVALRRGGIKVAPGRGDMKITIGGAASSGIGRLKMRDIVGGAEFGGYGRVTTYTQRRRGGNTQVTRPTTRQFGHPNPEGRFIYPTWNREHGPALQAWADAVEAMIDDYWQNVAAHA
jgi:hypothetical protein